MNLPNPFFKERFIQSSQAVQSLGQALRPRQWVVARSLCYFRVFNLQSIEPRERRNALNVKIMQWSPYQETGRYVLQHHDKALVWIWDAEQVQNAMYAQGVTTAHMAPEPLLQAPPREDGFRLLQCVEGCEGQYWKDNMLAASRWWPQPPQAEELAVFFVSNDLEGSPETAVEQVEYLARPWTRRLNIAEMLDVKREGFWVRAAALALVLLFAYFGFQYQFASSQEARYESRLADLESEIAPIKAAQNRMQAIYGKYMSLYEAVSGVSQLDLLYGVHQALPEIPSFKEWQFFEDTCQFVAAIPGLEPMDIVSRLQQVPAFENISVDRHDAGMYAVTFKVAANGP